MQIPFIIVFSLYILYTFAGLKLKSTSLTRRRRFLSNHELNFRLSKLHSTSPTSDNSSRGIVFDSDVVALSLVVVSVAFNIFFFGQTIKLEAKSDVKDIADKLVVAIDSKFAELKAESNAKFADQAKSLDELNELKIEGRVAGSIAILIGVKSMLEYARPYIPGLNQNVTEVKSKEGKAEKAEKEEAKGFRKKKRSL